jgi:hypothetical protein
MRRFTLCLLALLALVGAAGCGDDDDDDVTVADETTEDVADGPTEADGETAVAFFQSTEEQCAAHAEETGNPTVDPSWFADATFDLPMSQELGALVVIDGGGNQLIVNLDDEVVTGTDGRAGPLPQSYSFGCPEDLYLGTIDEGPAAAGDPCPPWNRWLSSGESADLGELEAVLHDDPAAGDILDSVAFLQGDPPTETAEDQQAYEANVDTITAALQEGYGCPPSRWSNPAVSG